jgi:hypothetical protein
VERPVLSIDSLTTFLSFRHCFSSVWVLPTGFGCLGLIGFSFFGERLAWLKRKTFSRWIVTVSFTTKGFALFVPLDPITVSTKQLVLFAVR